MSYSSPHYSYTIDSQAYIPIENEDTQPIIPKRRWFKISTRKFTNVVVIILIALIMIVLIGSLAMLIITVSIRKVFLHQ